jgi:Flp pilus assembly protein TadD
LAEAAAAFRRAVELAPSTVAAREALAAAAARLGRSAEHLRQLEELVRLEPDRVGRLVALAAAYDRYGRRESAVQVLTRATQQFPIAPEPYAALARLWLAADAEVPDRAARGKASEAATRAVDLARTSESLTALGRALLRSGDRRAALRALEDAVRTEPLDPAAYLLLAEAAEAVGRVSLARDALLRAEALAGDGNSRAAAQRALRIGVLSRDIGDGTAATRWLARAADLAAGDPEMARLVADARTAARRATPRP